MCSCIFKGIFRMFFEQIELLVLNFLQQTLVNKN